MPDAIDKPDEGEAGLEDGSTTPVPTLQQATEVPDWTLKLPKGASAADNGATLPPDPGDEDFGERTIAQRYEEADLLPYDDTDELWND